MLVVADGLIVGFGLLLVVVVGPTDGFGAFVGLGGGDGGVGPIGGGGDGGPGKKLES